MTTLDRIKEKVVKAVPEVREHYDRCMGCGYDFGYCKRRKSQGCPLRYKDRPITLADVLMAIKMGWARNERGVIEIDEDAAQLIALWNLALNLDDQTSEVHEFILKILDA